ncbi:hypothetical protein KMP13_15035 [Epibacterium ulvae]|uniref:hypothetical protein n=1 Tax=Epibacterium ulvae TaxID=1156985 RepID=UPI001BFC2A92|nr:hypothetical protein [Epibacterium ulvae]MBT8155161.1 hypothetical protein [Epibacterium ulvae]
MLDTIDPLEADELPWRTLYGTQELIQWLENVLPDIDHNELYDDLLPQEQVLAVFAEYVGGEEFVDDRRFKKLNWNPEYYVWELKTEEVRIFGWVPEKDVFICCFGDSKDTILVKDSYGRYIAQTVYVRNNLDLDDPKFVESGELKDVISNAT